MQIIIYGSWYWFERIYCGLRNIFNIGYLVSCRSWNGMRFSPVKHFLFNDGITGDSFLWDVLDVGEFKT